MKKTTQYLQIFSQHSIKKYSLYLLIVPLLINSCTRWHDIMFSGRVWCKCTGYFSAHSVNGSACCHSMHFITNSLCPNKLDSLKVVPSQTIYIYILIYIYVHVAVMDCQSPGVDREESKEEKEEEATFQCCHWSGVPTGLLLIKNDCF